MPRPARRVARRENEELLARFFAEHDSRACPGSGNVVMIVIDDQTVSEVVTGFGVKGVSAEKVAETACDEAQAYLAACVPVGIHLVDQLLIPMALAGGGTFRTLKPTAHTTTNAAVIRRFLDVAVAVEHEGNDVCRVTVGSA